MNDMNETQKPRPFTNTGYSVISSEDNFFAVKCDDLDVTINASVNMGVFLFDLFNEDGEVILSEISEVEAGNDSISLSVSESDKLMISCGDNEIHISTSDTSISIVINELNDGVVINSDREEFNLCSGMSIG